MFWSWEVAKKFDQLLTDTKPDIIHIHNIYHHLSPSLLPVAKRHNIPVVMTVHDYKLVWPHHLLYGYAPGASYWRVVRERSTQGSYIKSALTVLETYLHDWMGVYKNNIDLFLAPRMFLKTMMIDAGYDSSKIQVLPHFINLESRIPAPKLTRWYGAGTNQESRKKTLLFFGRLSKEKGVDTLLTMMHSMKSDVELRIVGTGPAEESLKSKVKSQKLQNVTFLGYVDDQTLADEIDRAELVVIPSLFPETFGFTVLEALAHGKAVVGSNIGAVPELIEDRKTGLLVKPGDAEDLGEKVQYLLSHHDERHAMERNARVVAKQYTPEEHYRQLFHYYETLL
ncbi:glycosyltransferase family 4 protein [Candidatus Uhrbacteria bacterium]|nr:glycosyltransferase family 4 protein [Candidatus Uhrbacteria bacterium]